ncbi:MAG TPA: DUF3108 domain-containing protein [Ignavibacteriaceae bacterium]|nr:DUF3108 domain-containing protein [Ignavibacteriaceae bacterium]
MNFREKIFLLSVIIIFYGGNIFGQAKEDEFRTIRNNAFKEGEKLTFDLKYGFVTAGISIMQIRDIRKIFGRDTYHITFEVNSVPSFDWIYKVRDRYETYLDVKGIFPWRFEQHLREGKFSRDFSAFFDQRNGKAKTTDGTYDIPPYVNDIVAAFYLARTYDYSKMEIGEIIHLFNFYKDKAYGLDIKYLGKEVIDAPAGKFNCIIVEPIIKEGGLFKSEGSIYVWLSDDQQKIPVRVKTKVVVGSVDAYLKSYEGLTGKLTSKISD